jgi:hypothetical protein
LPRERLHRPRRLDRHLGVSRRLNREDAEALAAARQKDVVLMPVWRSGDECGWIGRFAVFEDE